MVIITTLTSIGIAALISLLGWTLRRLVTGIDARFSGIDARFDRIDSRLDRFDDRFDRFEDSLKELRADMETQNKELRADMESQNKELRADMESQNKEVRADIASLREDHARLEGKLDGMLISKADMMPASEDDKTPAARLG